MAFWLPLLKGVGSFLAKPGILSGVGSILGGIAGMKKEKQPSVQDNILAQADAARQASEKYGFNPLTMLQAGNPSGTGLSSGGAPPLASIELLTSGLRDISDEVSGDASRRRAIEQFNLDLAKIKLDQARSGVVLPANNLGSRLGGEPAVLGRRATAVAQYDGPVPSYSSVVAAKGGKGYEVPNKNHPLFSTLGRISQPDVTIDRGAGVFIGGRHLEAPPGWSPAGHVEDEFGELVSLPYGLALSAAYAKHNLVKEGRDMRADYERSKGNKVSKVGGKYYMQEPVKKRPRAVVDKYGAHTLAYQKSRMSR